MRTRNGVQKKHLQHAPAAQEHKHRSFSHPLQTLHTHCLTPLPSQWGQSSPWHPAGLRQSAAGRGTATAGSAPVCSEGWGLLLPIPDTSTLSRGSPGWRCTREAGRCREQERVLAVLWPALPTGREGNWDAAETLRVCQPGSHPSPQGALPRHRWVTEQQRTGCSPAVKVLTRLLAQHDGSHGLPRQGQGGSHGGGRRWGRGLGRREGSRQHEGRSTAGNDAKVKDGEVLFFGVKHHHGQAVAPGSRGPSLHPTPQLLNPGRE